MNDGQFSFDCSGRSCRTHLGSTCAHTHAQLIAFKVATENKGKARNAEMALTHHRPKLISPVARVWSHRVTRVIRTSHIRPKETMTGLTGAANGTKYEWWQPWEQFKYNFRCGGNEMRRYYGIMGVLYIKRLNWDHPEPKHIKTHRIIEMK